MRLALWVTSSMSVRSLGKRASTVRRPHREVARRPSLLPPGGALDRRVVHLSASPASGLDHGAAAANESMLWPLVLMLFAQSCLYVGVGAVIPAIPLYAKAIGLSGAANGVVISAPALALVLGAPFSGVFADRARKPAMLLGMAMIVAADVGTATSTNFLALCVTRFVLGLGRCISEAGERAMLADLAARTPRMRGRAVAAQQALAALGIALGAMLGGTVVERFGARAAFLCVSTAATVTLVLYCFLPETLLKDPLEENPTTTDDKKNRPLSSSSSSSLSEFFSRSSTAAGESTWRTLLRDPRWRALCAAETAQRFGLAAKIAAVPLLASDLLGGAVGSGALVSKSAIAGLAGASAGGSLVDTVGPRAVAIGAGTIAGLCLLGVPWAFRQGGRTFTLLILAWSAATSAQGPALVAIQQQLAPKKAQALALALPRAVGDSAYVFAPVLLGSVADLCGHHGLRGAETALAGLFALVGALALAVGLRADHDSGTARRAEENRRPLPPPKGPAARPSS